MSVVMYAKEWSHRVHNDDWLFSGWMDLYGLALEYRQ